MDTVILIIFALYLVWILIIGEVWRAAAATLIGGIVGGLVAVLSESPVLGGVAFLASSVYSFMFIVERIPSLWWTDKAKEVHPRQRDVKVVDNPGKTGTALQDQTSTSSGTHLVSDARMSRSMLLAVEADARSLASGMLKSARDGQSAIVSHACELLLIDIDNDWYDIWCDLLVLFTHLTLREASTKLTRAQYETFESALNSAIIRETREWLNSTVGARAAGDYVETLPYAIADAHDRYLEYDVLMPTGDKNPVGTLVWDFGLAGC